MIRIHAMNRGFGSLVCYISCVQYLRYAPRFYILISALSNGLPSIARFLISIFPIFIGYAIAGTCWFGHYTRYVCVTVAVIVVQI